MDIAAYLQRINYHGSLDPSAETLRDLQVAHLLAVPFENLSIHYQQPIVLDDEALFDKIVTRRRGGFCYELNGLFCALLRGLGFKVEMLSARVANSAGEFGPEFDHMTLMVQLDQRWLADVGFGDSFREPLLIDERNVQVQQERSYRIDLDDDRYLLWQRQQGEEWKPQYSFSLQPFSYPDYTGMCQYHQTSSDSHFTKARICSRATLDGRLTLSDLRLITTGMNDRQEQLLESEEEYLQVLRERFDVTIRS
ncbi:MAG TPA: arylamine N-acetyltransferase [Pyrinomonadaceae bacterium]|nr:arylamine N-acetyltransferase [Pyrinomonadaceae bacterium]